jgi:glycosyltransferase involved in cell wall biosynthesis
VNAKPGVSILVPCFNAEPWIAQCIQSALCQTHNPIELIVLDDGSTDGTVSAVQRAGGPVRLIRGRHAGANAARNLLMHEASGEWLQFLDADDFLLPTKIERQLDALVAFPDADVLYSPMLLLSSATGRTELFATPEMTDPLVCFAQWGGYQTSSMLFRKAALIHAGGWREGQPHCQEHELLLRLLMSGKRVEFVDAVGTVYRQHEWASVSTRDPLGVLKTRMELTDRLEGHLAARGTLSPSFVRAANQARFQCARSAVELDRTYATALMAQVRRSSRCFRPTGPAAPPLYRLVFALAGFPAAEALAAWHRRRPRRGTAGPRGAVGTREMG